MYENPIKHLHFLVSREMTCRQVAIVQMVVQKYLYPSLIANTVIPVPIAIRDRIPYNQQVRPEVIDQRVALAKGTEHTPEF